MMKTLPPPSPPNDTPRISKHASSAFKLGAVISLLLPAATPRLRDRLYGAAAPAPTRSEGTS